MGPDILSIYNLGQPFKPLESNCHFECCFMLNVLLILLALLLLLLLLFEFDMVKSLLGGVQLLPILLYISFQS